MDFKNRLKGSLTQTLFRSLLVDAGYYVVPLGVEEVIREVNSLSQPQYQNLELPSVLRRMPDFFVADKNYEKYFLIEVKFRRSWNSFTREQLRENLYAQAQTWGKILLFVLLGETARPNSPTESNAQFIGAIWVYSSAGKLHYEGINHHTDDPKTDSWDNLDWNHFYNIQQLFPELIEKNKSVTQVRHMLKQLRDLDFFS
jgi:hypothetical protein